jgi:hypothetical protein
VSAANSHGFRKTNLAGAISVLFEDHLCNTKVTTSKCNSDLSRIAIKVTVKASQWTQVRQNMFSIPTQGFKSNQW